MSTYWGTRKVRVYDSDELNIDDNSDSILFTPGNPVDVKRIGLIVRTAVANASGVVDLTMHKRVAGASASETETFTLAVTDTTTLAQGAVVYWDMDVAIAQATGSDGSLVDVAPRGPLNVNVGEELQIEVENASDSGVVTAWVEYIELPFTGQDLVDAGATEKTVTIVL